jgi:hypothetical protein
MATTGRGVRASQAYWVANGCGRTARRRNRSLHAVADPPIRVWRVQARDLNLHYRGDPRHAPGFRRMSYWFNEPVTLSCATLTQIGRSSTATQPVGDWGHEGTRKDSARSGLQTGAICIRFEGGTFLELIDLSESE